MKNSITFRIALIVAIVIAIAIPGIIAKSGVYAEQQVTERTLKDVIIEGIPTCRKHTPAGDKAALRTCLKGKIIAFLKEQSQKRRTSGVTAQTPLPTLQPSPVSPAIANSEKVRMVRVVDGDTIEIEGGKRVRYIGIDTPETVDPRKPVQCFGKEASAENRELVEGKEILLEKDVSDTDRYGRLLRYVYVGDILINEDLVREGYATSYSYPPDTSIRTNFWLLNRMPEPTIEDFGKTAERALPVLPSYQPPHHLYQLLQALAEHPIRLLPPNRNLPRLCCRSRKKHRMNGHQIHPLLLVVIVQAMLPVAVYRAVKKPVII